MQSNAEHNLIYYIPALAKAKKLRPDQRVILMAQYHLSGKAIRD
jgi:hypothetical protein